MINKREILQPILDKIEPDWVIVKPSPLNPDNREWECYFQNQKPKDFWDAFVSIPNTLFDGNLVTIEWLVGNAIKNAKPRS